MKQLTIVLLLLIPTLALGHSMSPGFEVERTVSSALTKEYVLTNNYDFPAVYKIEVFTKDMEPAVDWKTSKEVYKILPNGKKVVKIKFKTDEKRKLVVCSTLTDIGKNNEKASLISRICSRLIIHRIR